MVNYLVGVDGGGTGTRVAIANLNGVELARGNAGPSGLINGADIAWNSIITAINDAFSRISKPLPPCSQIAIGIGLAGVHNSVWASNFSNQNPGFASMQLATDAYTTLLGAHLGSPGAIIALGTGSVGEALFEDGSRREVGGWGFPCGDEASGAWLGLRAINHLQQVIDDRKERSPFSDSLLTHCGGHRNSVFTWLANANQQNYAQIAPILFDHKDNADVKKILQEAGLEIANMALALDKAQTLPFALCGSLAKPLEKYVPASLLKRLEQPRGDSVTGALLLIKDALAKQKFK